MKKWHIVVDVDKCIGCFNCLMACKDEHVGNEWLPYTDAQSRTDEKWIDVRKVERGMPPRVDVAYRTELCNHCANAPCAKAAPDAVVQREDGIVLLDPAKAKGNRDLVKACPYGRISYNEEADAAQKCTLCAHLLDQGWKEPRCVQACPLKALKVLQCEDAVFDKLIQEKHLRPGVPAASRPRLYYKNAHRVEDCIVAGAIALQKGGKDTCAKGVAVSLVKDGKAVAQTVTDAYGDFRFDAVPRHSGAYTVSAQVVGYGAVSAQVSVDGEGEDLGTLYPKKAGAKK